MKSWWINVLSMSKIRSQLHQSSSKYTYDLHRCKNNVTLCKLATHFVRFGE